MAAATTIQTRNDESIEQVRATIIDQKLEDGFRIIVKRVRDGGFLPDDIAKFDGANVRHITSPSTWLPVFAGGGTFQLLPVTPDDNEYRLCPMPIVARLPQSPRTPDMALGAVELEGWDGPSELVWTIEADTHAGAQATGPQQPAPKVAATPKDSKEWQSITDAKVLLERERAQLALERAQITADAEKNRLLAQLDETERRAQLDKEEAERKLEVVKNDTEARMQRMEASFNEKLASIKVAQAAPAQEAAKQEQAMMLEMMKEQNANTLALIKANADAATKRAEDDAARERARADAAEKRREDEVKEARAAAKELATAVHQPSPQTKMIEDMAKTMTTVAQSMINMAQLSADLRPQAAEGEEKNQTAQLIDSVTLGIDRIGGKLIDLLKLGAMRQGQQQRQLPPAQTQPASPKTPPAAAQTIPAQSTPPKPVDGYPKTVSPAPQSTAPQKKYASGPHPDYHVQRVINLISAFTPPEELDKEVSIEIAQSEREPGSTFHQREIWSLEFLSEISPYLQGWEDREGKPKTEAYFDGISKYLFAQYEAEQARGVIPIAAPSGTLPAEQRNPVAPE